MGLERRDLLKAVGALTVTSVLGSGPRHAEASHLTSSRAQPQPNVLLFLTDDHGQWLQQAYGNSEVRTPNLDRIAREGVLMTNAYTTSPVCSPSRASFFTGRMPSQHGIHDWIEESRQAYAYPWLQGQTLLPELLKTVGYRNGLVGKWHCGEERVPHPGFDSWFSYWISQYPHTGQQNFSDNGKHITANGLQSPFLTEQAIQFLKNHYENKQTAASPFFLCVGYTDTHSPHAQMPESLVGLYKDASFRDLPREAFLKVHGTTVLPVYEDAEKENLRRQQYYAAASSVDREVGKVLDALVSLGQFENTIVIYASDHGLNAGHHGIWEKGNATIPQNFFEESIRVPCAVSWPGGGIPAGLKLDLAVNHCDLFATLLDAAGVVTDSQTAQRINSPGRSYLQHLRGKVQSGWRDYVICEYGNARMIKLNGYKLILRYPYQGVGFANELYNLKADPRETTNLYEDPRFVEQIARMTAKLHTYFETYSEADHDGLHLEQQPMATAESPWLQALKIHNSARGVK